MGRGDTVVSAPRLVPRWYVALVFVLLGAAFAAALLVSVFAGGVDRMRAVVSAVPVGLVLVAAATALLGHRRTVDVTADADGVTRVDSPVILVGSLVAAWAAFIGYALVTDTGSLTSPGFLGVGVLAGLGMVPDLWRLLTGRLHRWRLVLTPTEVTYRGYRTDVTVPWSRIHGAQIQARRPTGVRIDVKGKADDIVVAFRMPIDQMVDLVETYKASATR